MQSGETAEFATGFSGCFALHRSSMDQGAGGLADVAVGGVDRTIRVQHDPAERFRFLDRTARDPACAAYSRSLIPCMAGGKLATRCSAHLLAVHRERRLYGPTMQAERHT